MSITEKNGLKISTTLFNFINSEVLSGTEIKPDTFWDNFEKAVHELAPLNKNLILKREDIQKKLMNGTKEIKVKRLIKRITQSF